MSGRVASASGPVATTMSWSPSADTSSLARDDRTTRRKEAGHRSARGRSRRRADARISPRIRRSARARPSDYQPVHAEVVLVLGRLQAARLVVLTVEDNCQGKVKRRVERRDVLVARTMSRPSWGPSSVSALVNRKMSTSMGTGCSGVLWVGDLLRFDLGDVREGERPRPLANEALGVEV